jgi:hypothetical protein
MKTHQRIYIDNQWDQPLKQDSSIQLITVFGNRHTISDDAIRQDIMQHYPNADIIGCSTAGEISGTEIYDSSLCLTAMSFHSSTVAIATTSVTDTSLDAAISRLLQQLPTLNLQYVMVLSDGQHVNGTQLVKGLKENLPNDVLITGGLAGDDTRFEETVVWHNNDISSGKILLCGFYGNDLIIGHGSQGGWDSFGPTRIVTQSTNNVLQELDNKSALELYKEYLGDHAKDLPASALLFPLLVTLQGENDAVIRTILNIDEDTGSMIFAGDIPEGATAQLMRANFDRLIDGAEAAAENALKTLSNSVNDGLILMISCVGRRLVLNQRTEEELESVQETFGDNMAYTGFYSYGEISPLVHTNSCSLHNQTMTITVLSEKNA